MIFSLSRRISPLSVNPWPILAKQFHSQSCNKYQTKFIRNISTNSSISNNNNTNNNNSNNSELRVLRLNVPILEQLRIEESLLRLSPDNHLIINNHTGPDSIVIGISGRPELWTYTDQCENDNILCIKRFTGGGTVYVDHNTLFITFLMQKSALPNVQPYPQAILEWVYKNYQPVFNHSNDSDNINHNNNNNNNININNSLTNNNDNTSNFDSRLFSLNSNDFCFGFKKVGGNAQSITRNAFLHHTSWLWRCDPNKMQKYLTQPPESRMPEYRKHRKHQQFVSSLYNEWNFANNTTNKNNNNFNHNNDNDNDNDNDNNNNNDNGDGDGDGDAALVVTNDARYGLNLLSEELFLSLERQGWNLIEDSFDSIKHFLSQPHDKVTKIIDWKEEKTRINKEKNKQ